MNSIFTELPYGWEEIKDPHQGGSIYIDHNTGKDCDISFKTLPYMMNTDIQSKSTILYQQYKVKSSRN